MLQVVDTARPTGQNHDIWPLSGDTDMQQDSVICWRSACRFSIPFSFGGRLACDFANFLISMSSTFSQIRVISSTISFRRTPRSGVVDGQIADSGGSCVRASQNTGLALSPMPIDTRCSSTGNFNFIDFEA
ncbi:hypothetical protein ACXPWS_29015 [Mycobacterium sp. BMJ-28]